MSTVKKNRSSDEEAYRQFSLEMSKHVLLENQSEEVDVIVKALVESEYYEKLKDSSGL